MQKNTHLFIAVLVVILLAVSAMACTSLFKPASAEVTSVTTDRDLYHSNDVMMMKILVNSTGITTDTSLKIEGITDTYGQTRLSHIMRANLTPGPNVFLYDYHLPTCSKCSGLDPGNYPLNITLDKNGTIISNMTITVRLEQ
ncbi:MAG: hypothetical protein WCJ93_08865 [Methanomicrobiales archaeon]